MTTFADAASTFIESQRDAPERQRAWKGYEAVGLPTTSDEVWRYAPLDELVLDRFAVATRAHEGAPSPFAARLSSHAGLVVRVVDGFLVETGTAPAGVRVAPSFSLETLRGENRVERYGRDAFSLLNAALAPVTVVVSVAPGVVVDAPIVLVHETHGSSSFPRTQIEMGEGSRATIVEYYEGGEGALVVPLSEYHVGENAELRLITYQRLDQSAWHVARSTGIVERDARLSQAVLGMGAYYNRSRNDAVLLGAGGRNELRTTFLGSASQVHDFRTRQFHVGARSSSVLLSKGAVAGASRCVYTGLIEIEKGAKRTDARQTNHNLLLSHDAHADSVPNLEIRENDVVCAHASSVGPLDELQRWYLESRGVSRADAERLMIQGFFNEMLVALPDELAHLVEGDVNESLRALHLVAS